MEIYNLVKQMESGDLDATYTLAMLYLEGKKVSKDIKIAISYLKKIAHQFPKAAYSLGIIYEQLAKYNPTQYEILYSQAKDAYILAAHQRLPMALRKLNELGVKLILKHTYPEHIPLSFAQQRLWFLDKLLENKTIYNIPIALCLRGELNKVALQQALDALLARHEILRTSLVEHEEEGCQDIKKHISFPLLTKKITEAELKAIVVEEAATFFDLSHAPLIRGQLLELSEGNYVLLLTQHHIVGDGWSMGVMARDISQLYNHYAYGDALDLPTLEIQYADYTIWQREYLSGERLKSELDYWKEALHDAPTILELPTDKPRPKVLTNQGLSYRFKLSKDIVNQLHRLNQQQETTLFMSLLASLYVLLYRYSGQEDMVIGSPIANRTTQEVEHLIGLFMNTLLFRCRLNPQMSFIELLQQVKQTTLGAYQHQDIPFEYLVDELKIERDLSRNPLFQVMLVLQNNEQAILNLKRVEVTLFEQIAEQAKVDLTFTVIEKTNDDLIINIQYATDLYQASTIERLANHWQVLFQGIIANPQAVISELPILTWQEQKQLLVGWNQTQVDYPKEKTIHHLFEEQVERTPNNMAVEFEDKQLTYRELNEKANQLAHSLQDLGIAPGAIIGISVARGLDFIVGILATLKAGCAYVPLDTSYPTERLVFMLEDTKAPVLLTHSQYAERFVGYRGHVLCLDKITLDNEVRELNSIKQPANDIVYVIYTSGSTGEPKGVMVSHANVGYYLFWFKQAFGITANDIFDFSSSISFDLSVTCSLLPLTVGASIAICSDEVKKEPSAYLTHLTNSKVTIAKFTPSYLELLTQERIKDLAIRYLIVGGEGLYSDTVRRWLALYPQQQVVNEYGPTEATVAGVYLVANSQTINNYGMNLPIGKPAANTQVYVLDNQRQLVPQGVIGELYIGGAGVARGYLNRPNLTQERFIPNPYGEARLYKTGDLVRYLSDGNIEYLGRTDFQVKIRGFRIELGEIESILRQQSPIKDVAVIAREDAPGDKRLVAYLIGEAVDTASLREALKARLPDYMIPSAFVVMDKLPLNSNGKLDRKALPKPEYQATEAYIAPSSEAERVLVSACAEVLRIPVKVISVNANFFELGGDSIISIQLVSKLRDKGWQIGIQAIFAQRTLADLASVMQQQEMKIGSQTAIEGEVPLLPIQHGFFSQSYLKPWHYNQALLLKVKQPLAEDRLQAALIKLLEQHDMLRAVYQETPTGWQQQVRVKVDSNVLEIIAVKSLEELTKACERLHSSFDLAQGPLFKAALIQLPNEQRLFLVAHHLVIDGVSWRILAEDLIKAYKGEALSLKTNSYRDWVQALMQYPISEQEKVYWQAQATPIRLPQEKTASTHQRHRLVMTLSAAHTDNLLHAVSKAYQTQINDILLTALALTFAKWSDSHGVGIWLESHGRVNTDALNHYDLSRTIGWFTSLFPLRLNLAESNDIGSAIQIVKEQLRAIPANGIGYGILHYYHAEEVITKNALPQITFNYLGQTDNNLSDELFSMTVEPSGASIAVENQRSTLFDINGMVVGGQLRLTWDCADGYSEVTLAQLAQAYQAQLEAIIAHCMAQETIHYTPSDFPLANVNQQKLNDIVQGIREVQGSAVALEDIYPLSPLQMGLAFQSVLRPESDNYFVQLVFEFAGAIDEQALQKAWQAVLNAQSILRTGILIEHELQYVVKELELPWESLDWQGLNKDEQPVRLQAHIKAQRQQPFVLNKAPLLRIQLIRCAPEHYYLILNNHHVLLDGWSMPLVYSQVIQAYEQLTQDKALRLVDRKPYRDYIAWLANQDKQQALAKWQEQLQGIDEPSLLMDVLPTGDKQAVGEKELSYQLDKAATIKLTQLAKQQYTTPNIIVQTALSILLTRYLQKEDIVFGVTVSGRETDLAGHSEMVGLFINSLPLRITLTPNLNVSQALQQVQATMRRLSQYSYLQLAEVQRLSGFAKGLFDVLYVFENYPISESVRQSGLPLASVKGIEQTEYPLTVTCHGSDDALTIKLSFKQALVVEDAITKLGEHLLHLLQGMLAQPTTKINQLPLLTEQEKRIFLHDWNQTQVDYPKDKTIHQLFEEQAARLPDSIAVVFEDKQLSYRELNERANQLAHYLITLGIKPNSLIAISLERSIELMIGLLGILKAGGAYVPLETTHPAQRLHTMLTNADIHYIVSSEQIDVTPLQTLNPALKVIRIETIAGQELAVTNPAVAIDSTSNSYVIYTSGSTGEPKGVANIHTGTVNRLLWMQAYSGMTEQDVILQKTPYTFDVSVWEFFLPLIGGAKLVLAKPQGHKDPDYLANLIEQQGITILHFVPSMLQSFVNYIGKDRCQGMRKVYVSGEALSVELRNQFFDYFPKAQLHNLYGPTEASVDVSFWDCGSDKYQHLVPIGKPIWNTQLYILDKQLNVVPQGVIGELYIGGVGLARGYLNRPDLTDERFIQNPFGEGRLYKTGDLVRYLPDGNIEYLGRTDFQVKIRGLRIELGEIESILRQQSQIKDVAVIAREDTPGDKRLVAYLVGEAIDTASLREVLKVRLPEYMVPSAFVVMDKLPLNSNGKLDRKALPKPKYAAKSPLNLSATEIEKELLNIWSEVLHVDNISTTDNFFDLGGHSLLIVQVNYLIHKKFSISINVGHLVENPTIEQLVRFLRNYNQLELNNPLVTIQPFGDKPALFCIHPVSGDILCYLNLSKALGKEYPVYGLQQTEILKDKSIEEMASYYVQAIRQKQAHGPYYVMGYSLGGLIAHEIAYQLEQLGEKIQQLMLVESPFSPRFTQGETPVQSESADKVVNKTKIMKEYMKILGKMYGQEIDLGDLSKMETLNTEERRLFVLNQLKNLPVNLEELNRTYAMADINVRKTINFKVKRINCPFVYFYGNQMLDGKLITKEKLQQGLMILHEYTKSEIKLVELPGNHFKLMVDEALNIMVATLKKYLV